MSYLNDKNRGWYLVGYITLALLTIWSAFPIYWMLTTSLTGQAEMYSTDLRFWPKEVVWDNYAYTFVRSPFPRAFLNSLIVAIVVTAAAMVIASLAAYSLTRLRYQGRRVAARVLVASYLAPAAILFIPMYVLVMRLGLHNTLPGLTLAHLTTAVPFSSWLLVGYMRTLPIELEESALVDGANRLQLLFRIIIPLTAPAMVVVAVFSFTLSWNEFLYALVLLQRAEVMTAPVSLTFFQVIDIVFWGPLMAASTAMAIPPVALYLLGQRWVVSGWTIGAVKA